MTRDEIKTELNNLRFTASTVKDAQILKWISQAEIWVWNQADWRFKEIGAQNLTTTISSGIASAAFPTGMSKIRNLRRSSDGAEMIYVSPDVWDRNFRSVPASLGSGSYYTVRNRTIFVGPGEATTFNGDFVRKYHHLADGATPTAGVMNSANDTPIWDSEHHYVLVPTAIIIGMGLESDPTKEALRIERDEMLFAMKEELSNEVTSEVRFWGG
jgi:hypothetical protein